MNVNDKEQALRSEAVKSVTATQLNNKTPKNKRTQIKEKRNKTLFPLLGSGLCECVSVTFFPLTDSLRQRRTSQSQGDVQDTVNLFIHRQMLPTLKNGP